jgi:hypothetical protein
VKWENALDPFAGFRRFGEYLGGPLCHKSLRTARIPLCLLILHPAQFFRNGKQRELCLPTNLVSASDFQTTPGRCSRNIRRFGFKRQLGRLEKIGTGGVSTFYTRRNASRQDPAADVSNRRRSMLNGKSVLAISALLLDKGLALSATFADCGHIAASGRPPCLRKPVSEGASLRLDAGGRMEQKEKRSHTNTHIE